MSSLDGLTVAVLGGTGPQGRGLVRRWAVAGVPVVIGAGGVEKVVEVKLSDEAKANLQVSVDAVKELLVACKGIDGSLA